MRLEMPKVYYLFYKYFFRAVVGQGRWKRQFTEARFGTNVLEAYAHAVVQNNYFAWLYAYKQDHPGSTLKMEYNLVDIVTSSDGDNVSNNAQTANGDTDEPHIYCGDLDEVEIALPDDNAPKPGGTSFTLVLDEGSTKEAYKAAKEAADLVRKDTIAKIKNRHQHVQLLGKLNKLLTSSNDESSQSLPPQGRNSETNGSPTTASECIAAASKGTRCQEAQVYEELEGIHQGQ